MHTDSLVSNVDLWRQTNQEQIQDEIKCRNWGWIGHTLGKYPNNMARNGLDDSKRKPGDQ